MYHKRIRGNHFSDGLPFANARDSSNNDRIRGSGGHIEDCEAPIQTAIRETQEEFGITPVDLMYMGTQGENSENTHCTAVYLCTSFSGTPKADGKEMHGALFLPPDTLDEQFGDHLFPPFADSLKMPESAQIMQTLSMDISGGCGIIKEDQDGPGAPIGNDNAAKDHVSEEGSKGKWKEPKSLIDPDAYEKAKGGGKYAGTYRQALAKTEPELSRSINSHQKQADLHRDKLTNPKKYIRNWDVIPAKKQEQIRGSWEKHVKKNQEEADIERKVFADRRKGAE